MADEIEVEDGLNQLQPVEADGNYDERAQKVKFNDLIDSKFGFDRYTGTAERDAWLINFQPAELIEEQTKAIISAVDFYFIQGNGERFKISYPFRPYFYISTSDGAEHQVASFLTKKYGGFLVVDIMDKEDLDLKNHLSGLKKTYLKLSFPSTSELAKVKRDLMPHIRKNKERVKKESQYCSYLARNMGGSKYDIQNGDVFSDILDIREYDLPYHMRVAIDEKYFVGKWYTVRGISSNRKPSIVSHPTLIDPIDPVVLAFDIETTKLPLKFPDSSTDEIMMISYMIDGKGFLIINRDIVSADIESFEYTPKEEYKGKFFIFNEPDETATIKRFFDHILEVRPNVIVTYNGDFFDWPFVETRARIRGINMEDEIGFAKDSADEFKSRNCIHMDAFRWVKRDSYLPVGSQNLKAVAKAKLRYDPVEVDPEDMCKMAREDPQSLANYSVSDAVATYYLYMKYVHPFVFALCTIIPLGPDDVLRKGSGTLCEALLMVEAFHNNIVFPNKFTGDVGLSFNYVVCRIESETYVGGHVEALEAGVFRADIPCKFRLAPAALKSLRDSVPETIEKELIREFGIPLENVVDFEERCAEVQETFDNLLAIPARMENPRIYHLDVGAMYPNIILTNRLQPCAMVNEEICMACTYNRPDAKCKRVMNWEWRGELTPATRGELQQIIQQLEGETFGKPPKAFHQLERAERQSIEKKRVQDYCRRVYGRTHLTRLEMRQTMICQRENAFYVDTVKAFRDRRYEYKELLKKAKGSLDEISKDDIAGIKAAQGRVVLYESLQLAHKCILNSFYGYVMRKGSRWFSMEMAGIVCHTGANIITEARKLVEQIGKPLELDTDGIWCLLPASFPENITFKLQNHKRKSITVSYPGAMLNAVVNAGFTNDQYHNLQPDGSYTISKENSIFFEVDGPYQCMVLPASKEEGKKLKKRYAVFNLDGSLAELKGFEVKRRGELNIIKHFQSAVFKAFLRGTTLAEVYESASREADYWLDVLFSKGGTLADAELFDLISENRSMSRKLEDYGAQKSTSISTAKRLAEFLGADMVKDAGLACKFVISRHPLGSPVTERAVPIAIFLAEDKVRLHYLKQWTKQPALTMEKTNIRELLDWDYYIERLGSCIQKIITIPAALQGLPNPVPRIAHPDWLDNKIKNRFDALRQPRITDLFQKRAPEESNPVINEHGKRCHDGDIEQEERMDRDEDKENEPKKQRQIVEKAGSAPSTSAALVKKTLARDGFDEWLKYLKKKWRILKVSSVHSRKERASTMVERMISHTRDALRDRIWQILSIEETRTPGIYNIWVALEGRMDRFQLRVPRLVIINEKEPVEGKEVVRRVLPHHKLAHYLYEYSITGSTEQKLMEEINEKLCCSRVEGIYESQTPLMFRAMTQIGCLCRPLAPPIGGVYSLEVDAQDAPTFVRLLSFQRFHSRGFPLQVRAATMRFNTRHFRVVAEAEKEVNKAVRMSREATAKSTVLCMLVDEDPKQMMKRIVHLTLFPHVRIHVQEPHALLNVMEWQRVVAKRICKHYFNSFIYLKDYADWARYLHVPIGSVPSDAGMFGLDLFFARNLQKAGHVLWASPSSRPDLGGKELDDLRLTSDWKPLTQDETVLLNNPSFCGSVCVEFELEAVAVTALVQRGRLLEAEGADDAVAFDSTAALPLDAYSGLRNTISAFDEGAAVDAALKILKQMLTDCVRDIAQGANKRADEVVMSLSRWLHSPNSLLFDPAITRSVSILERKLVLLLAAECERLGAKIIHATPTKLVLDTGKRDQEQGSAFTELLLQSLRQNPLFAALHMTPLHTWTTLLWYDGYNNTGVCEKTVECSTVESETSVGSQTKAETRHHWRLADDLPNEGAVREEFRKIVTGYVMLYMQQQTKEDFNAEAAVTFRHDLVKQHIGHRLFRVVSKLACQRLTYYAAASLVKVICTALSCDSAVEDSVDGLRENLHRILDSKEAPPTRDTVYLSNVFCSNCSIATNIDVGDELSWTCKECAQPLVKSVIDETIAERLNTLMTAYLLQDHVCSKCKSIRRDNISKYCDCSGNFVNTIDATDLIRDAKAVGEIGEKFGLPLSAEMSRWICAGVEL
ncbi:hypothetical protein ANCCAN_19206 [Ancylostoma caninum]|uniref:DNA polymerase epsilon catalytic subunit n=1 Tax=Ancylostoma caninum TaxID=29170 RepID=A0A368FU19_ANCCA|nr:hypothetical protein ANCCAN_19206 [Ancylostoma caninum]